MKQARPTGMMCGCVPLLRSCERLRLRQVGFGEEEPAIFPFTICLLMHKAKQIQSRIHLRIEATFDALDALR